MISFEISYLPDYRDGIVSDVGNVCYRRWEENGSLVGVTCKYPSVSLTLSLRRAYIATSTTPVYVLLYQRFRKSTFKILRDVLRLQFIEFEYLRI